MTSIDDADRRAYRQRVVSLWDNEAVVGALGVVFGGGTAYIQGALSARTKASEELRDRRLECYPELWRQTAALSHWPRPDLTWQDVRDLHVSFRRWYYTAGGLYLSTRSRARYGEVQELLSAQLASVEDLSTAVIDPARGQLSETCSVLRTALTEDLATRRQRSLAWTITSAVWHARKARKARARIKAAGKGVLVLPASELELAPPPSGTVTAGEGS